MTKAIQICIILACLAGSAFLLYRYFTRPIYGQYEGAHIQFYLCSNGDCATEYSVQPKEDLGDRQAYDCPECGSPAADAARCPSCGRMHMLVGHGRYLADCPHCGDEMPPLVEQLKSGERAARRSR